MLMLPQKQKGFLLGMNLVWEGGGLLSDSNHELLKQPSSGSRRTNSPGALEGNVWNELCSGIARGWT